jgi:hypothetical protein
MLFFQAEIHVKYFYHKHAMHPLITHIVWTYKGDESLFRLILTNERVQP